MSNSMRSHKRQPTRLPRPWDSPGKNTGVGGHFPLQCMKVKSGSEVAQSCLTLATPWTAAYQAPPSMGFSGKTTGVGCHCLLQIIYMEKIKRFQIMGSIYCVEIALTWAVPLHGFWCTPPKSPNTHTHFLFYRTPPVPHLTRPYWGWLAHGRAFNVWLWLLDMWSGKQKGNIQSETSRRQLVRWDCKFPQEVRVGLEQS